MTALSATQARIHPLLFGQRPEESSPRQLPRENGVIVYGSQGVGCTDSEYNAAEKLGSLIANIKSNNMPAFVITGGGKGLSEAIAQACIKEGSHAVGIRNSDLMTVAGTSNVYPEVTLKRSFADVIWGRNGYEERGMRTLALPGSAGTEMEILCKAMELWTNTTLLPSQKRIVLLDPDGFFTHPQGLIPHLKYITETRGWPPDFMDMFKIARTPQEAVRLLFEPGVPMTTGRRLDTVA